MAPSGNASGAVAAILGLLSVALAPPLAGEAQAVETASTLPFTVSGSSVFLNGNFAVTATYLSNTAAFNNLMGFSSPVNQDLFRCHDVPAGFTVNVGVLSQGELILRISTPEGYTFFSGPGSRNPDGLVHVRYSPTIGSAMRVTVGFEDLFNNGDQDFDDCVIDLCADMDGDGLTGCRESDQGTSDSAQDMDGDGLSDFIESQWNPDRNAIFCGQICDVPNPTYKDIYVEIDWMVKPDTRHCGFFGCVTLPDTGYSMRPPDQLLDIVRQAFSRQGISLHFDVEQLGGGSVVPYVERLRFASPGPIVHDFYDIKNGGDGIDPQFNGQRFSLFHYMIIADRAGDDPLEDTSDLVGRAWLGDDDAVIFYGNIRDSSGLQEVRDALLASAIIHELGHNLCLSPPLEELHDYDKYPEQHQSCRYIGVDKPWAQTYESAMNYAQTLIDYSDGSSAEIDHDDWSAVLLGLDDFTKNSRGDELFH